MADLRRSCGRGIVKHRSGETRRRGGHGDGTRAAIKGLAEVGKIDCRGGFGHGNSDVHGRGGVVVAVAGLRGTKDNGSRTGDIQVCPGDATRSGDHAVGERKTGSGRTGQSDRRNAEGEVARTSERNCLVGLGNGQRAAGRAGVVGVVDRGDDAVIARIGREQRGPVVSEGNIEARRCGGRRGRLRATIVGLRQVRQHHTGLGFADDQRAARAANVIGVVDQRTDHIRASVGRRVGRSIVGQGNVQTRRRCRGGRVLGASVIGLAESTERHCCRCFADDQRACR